MRLIQVLSFVLACRGKVAYIQQHLSRRDFGLLTGSAGGAAAVAAGALLIEQTPALAFEGSGSSAYTGKSPTTRAALRKGYQDRVAADVKDFNALGAAIGRGETDGDAWFFFFTDLPRKNPDDAGRTYAALADLIGVKAAGGGKMLEGGDGLLLANTFTKAGKPPDNTPAVKSFNALSKAFDPIRVSGMNGNARDAKVAWEKASVLFAKYLSDVDLPSALDDPLYN